MKINKRAIMRVSALLLIILSFSWLIGCSKDKKEENLEKPSNYQAKILSPVEKKEDEALFLAAATPSKQGVAMILYRLNPELLQAAEDMNDLESLSIDTFFVILNEQGKPTVSTMLDFTIGSSYIFSLQEMDDESFRLFIFSDLDSDVRNIEIYSINPLGVIAEEPKVFSLSDFGSVESVFLNKKGDFLYLLGTENSVDSRKLEIGIMNPVGEEKYLFRIGANKIKEGESVYDASLFTDNEFVYMHQEIRSNGENYSAIRKIDIEKRQLSDPVFNNETHGKYMFSSVISGTGSSFGVHDKGIYRIKTLDETIEPVFQWGNVKGLFSSAVGQNIRFVSDLQEGLIFIIVDTDSDDQSSAMKSEFYLLEKSDISDNEIKTITISGVGFSNNEMITKAVYNFNQSQSSCQVVINEYMDGFENANPEERIKALNVAIVAGEKIDVICGSVYQSLDTYINQSIMVDLKMFIEQDSTFIPDTFFENLIYLSEQDGKLFQIFPAFTFGGFVGGTSLVADYESGWTMEEFDSWASTLPEKMEPIFGLTYIELLVEMFSVSQDAYVNWETNEVKFDSAEFLDLLNFIKKYGSPPIDQSELFVDDIASFEKLMSGPSVNDAIRNKEIALFCMGSQNLDLYTAMSVAYEETVSIVGYPALSESRAACYPFMQMGISENSQNKNEAWEFISYLFSEEIQNMAYDEANYPVRRDVMDNLLAEQRKVDKDEMVGSLTLSGSPLIVKFESAPLSDENAEVFLQQVEKVDILITGNNEILDILMEESEPFFEDEKSASDVAKVIQSRVQTLVNEK